VGAALSRGIVLFYFEFTDHEILSIVWALQIRRVEILTPRQSR